MIIQKALDQLRLEYRSSSPSFFSDHDFRIDPVIDVADDARAQTILLRAKALVEKLTLRKRQSRWPVGSLSNLTGASLSEARHSVGDDARSDVRLSRAEIRGNEASIRVTFHCGPLCGRVEDVFLRKLAEGWRVESTSKVANF